jgi:HEAT repeat protein
MGADQKEHVIDVAAEIKRLGKNSTRLEAIATLGKSGADEAVGPLVELLGDKDGDVREAAAEALGMLGETALEAVSDRFWKADAMRTKMAALSALSLAGQGGTLPAGVHLQRILSDRGIPSKLRVAALSALMDVQGEDALAQIAEALADKDRSLRRRAVQCLRAIPLSASTDLLIGLAADADEKIRSRALKGLHDRYSELLARLSTEDTSVLPVLLSAWRAGDEDEDLAAQIEAARVDIGAQIVPALVEMLVAEETGADLIDVLARFGPEAGAAYDVLLARLDHPDQDTCCAAARALGALKQERAMEPLVACLTFDAGLLKAKKHDEKQAQKRDLALQRAAAEALGLLGRPALPAVLHIAASEDPVARQGGALALGYIGGGRALGAVERLTSDKDDRVREAAAEALERLAAQDVPRLGRMLRNKDPRVRRKAVAALARLDDLRSLDLLLRAYGDSDERVHQAAVEALARREGTRASTILIAAAAGGNVVALQALQELPVRHAIPALVEALDSPWYEVYSTALETLCIYGAAFAEDEEAMSELRALVPDLMALLRDDAPKVRRLALRAVEEFQESSLAEHVADLLLDPKKSVQVEAARVLAVVGGSEAGNLLADRLAQVKSTSRQKAIQEAFSGAAAGPDQ